VADIVFVRHADTDWTASGQHTGDTDLVLNEQGRAAARRLPARLAHWSFVAVYTSPMMRARQTCEIAGYDSQSQERAELREWDYGDYEGLTTAAIREQRPDWDMWRDGCPGGEDAAAVGARADAFLHGLLPVAGEVLVFSHGHLLRVMIARWLGLEPAEGALFAIAPGGVGVLEHERERRILRLVD
jgi:broad specificity phosphatase PhoE